MTFSKGAHTPLVWILVIGTAVRLGLWLWFGNLPIQIHDEKDYDKLAKNLVEHGEFGWDGQRLSLRPPLYPFLVAGIYATCGVEYYQAVRLVQAVLSLVNVLVVYGLGREVASQRTAWWLAGLFCFYPSLLGFNCLLLTETLFTLLLCTFCYLMALAYRRQAVAYLAVAGLVLGLASLARSIMWMSPPLFTLFLLITWQASWPRRLVAAMALLVPFAVTLAPWSIRNTLLEKTFVAVDTMGGTNFMLGNYQYTPLYRAWDAISLKGKEDWFVEVSAAYPYPERDTQGKKDKLAFKRGLLFVSEHPWLTVQRDIIKFFDFWGLERELVAGAERGYFGPMSWLAVAALAVIICLSYVAVLFVGIFGLLLAPLTDRRMHWMLFLIVVYTCALHTIVYGHSRYHVPVMPLMMVFAASAITATPPVWHNWRRPAFWLATGICAVIAGGWLWSFIAGDWDKIRQMMPF